MDSAGLGVSLPVPDDVSNEALFKVLVRKVRNPQEFLPVTDVTATDITLASGREGVAREMTLGGRKIFEDIYWDEGTLAVHFVDTGDARGTEIVNQILVDETGGRSLGFWKANVETGERLPWDVPKSAASRAIQGCIDKARDAGSA
jgi:hypothetical protein